MNTNLVTAFSGLSTAHLFSQVRLVRFGKFQNVSKRFVNVRTVIILSFKTKANGNEECSLHSECVCLTNFVIYQSDHLRYYHILKRSVR